MYGETDIIGDRSHLHGEYNFTYQFACSRADHSGAQNPFGLGIDNKFGQTVIPPLPKTFTTDSRHRATWSIKRQGLDRCTLYVKRNEGEPQLVRELEIKRTGRIFLTTDPSDGSLFLIQNYYFEKNQQYQYRIRITKIDSRGELLFSKELL